MKALLLLLFALTNFTTNANIFNSNMGNSGSSSKPSASSSSVQEFIKSEVEAHQVVVFSKSYCPHCSKTKQLFAGMKDVDTAVHELDNMPNGAAIQENLLQMTGQRTVPNVWVKGQHLGGNDDTQAAKRSGKLQEMLQA